MLLRTIFEAQTFEPSSSENNNRGRFEAELFNFGVTLEILQQSKSSDLNYNSDIRSAENHIRVLKALAAEAQTQGYPHAAQLQQQVVKAVDAARKVWRGGHSAYSYMHNRPHVWPDDENTGGIISGVVLVPEWDKQPPPPSYTVFVNPKDGSNKIVRLFEGNPEFSIKGVIPGEYTVFIHAQDYKALSSAKPVTVQAGQEAKIRFSMEYDPPGSGLKTRVMPKW